MFSQSVELYDLIYSSLKDYGAEARSLAAIIQEANPGARTVLDVGCGTGEHARALVDECGYQVDGIDLVPGFVELAAAKVPSGTFLQGDMRTFDLGRQYDAIVCLFSAIGYVVNLEGLDAALDHFRAHLAPGGVLIIEPWFRPDQWRPGYISQQYVEAEDRTVMRMSHADVEGTVSILSFHYLIGTRAGIEHRQERHELALFTQAEMMDALQRAGFAVGFQSEGPTGRGLYVATLPRPA